MQFEPLQIVAGGVVGFAGAVSLRWWQYQRDMWIGEVERFCDTLIEAADFATEYWLTKKTDAREWDPDREDLTKEQQEEHRSLAVQEAKIQGLQGRLDGLLACFLERLSFSDRSKLYSQMASFADALTGGNFGGVQRDIDSDRAQLAQVYAAELLISIRVSTNKAVTLRAFAGWLWDRLKLRHLKKWQSNR